MSLPRRRWPDALAALDRQTDETSFQVFVSGVRFSRSFQEANPISIWPKAAFVSGLSYQLVLSSFRQDIQLTKTALRLRDLAIPCPSRKELAIFMSLEAHRYLNPPAGDALPSQLARPRSASSSSRTSGLLQR